MVDILLSAPYMLPFVKRFQPAFDHYGIHLIIANVAERLSANDLMDYAGQFDGTICGDDAYTAPVLQACAPRLKVISKWGTGIDSFDRQAAKDLGIKICNTKDAFTSPVADSVLGYLLAFARKQPWLDKAMKSCEWKKIHWELLGSVTSEKLFSSGQVFLVCACWAMT